MKLKFLLGAVAMLGMGGVAHADGIFGGWPLIGGPSYCATFTNGVCSQVVPAGETSITGLEAVPADLGPFGAASASGLTNGLLSVTQLGNGALVDLTTVATAQTIANSTAFEMIDGAQGSAFTVTMPAAPVDGQVVRVFCTSATVGVMTVAANTGQTLKNNPAAACTAGVGYSWRYNVANTTWYRVQ